MLIMILHDYALRVPSNNAWKRQRFVAKMDSPPPVTRLLAKIFSFPRSPTLLTCRNKHIKKHTQTESKERQHLLICYSACSLRSVTHDRWTLPISAVHSTDPSQKELPFLNQIYHHPLKLPAKEQDKEKRNKVTILY